MCKRKSVKFDVSKDEYRKWCSVSCACKDPSTLAKSRKTRLDKYGSETYSGADKARKTRMSKNNGHWHSAGFADKLKQTKLEKYGDENFVNSSKARETKLARYGDEHFCMSSRAFAARCYSLNNASAQQMSPSIVQDCRCQGSLSFQALWQASLDDGS